jgi:hypothetical protein
VARGGGGSVVSAVPPSADGETSLVQLNRRARACKQQTTRAQVPAHVSSDLCCLCDFPRMCSPDERGRRFSMRLAPHLAPCSRLAERIGLRDRSTFGLRRSQVPRRLRNTRTDRALARAPPTPQQHPRHQPWLMKRSSSFVFELLFVPAESMLESCRVHSPLAALVRSQLDTCAAPSSDLRWNVYTPEPCSTLIVSPLPRRRLPIRW